MGTAATIAGSMVELKNSAGHIARFNENYGGILTELRSSVTGQNVVDPFPGAGFQMVFDSGQDGTQGTCNGPWPYAITGNESYFASRRALIENFRGEGHYVTEGICPFFWLSHEAIDDVIPPRTDLKNHGWSTKYHNVLSLADSVYIGAETPIFFKGTADVPSGIIFMGDSIKQIYAPGRPWMENVATVLGGAIACRLKISMALAPAGSLASILFKKEITPLDAGSNIDTAYGAEGYHLNINKEGGCELRQFPGDVLLWAAPPTLSSKIRTAIATDRGVEVMITTEKNEPSVTKIYFDGGLALTADLPFDGGAFGFLASAASGRIKFASREVFDTQSVLRAHWRTYGAAFRATMEYVRSGPVEHAPLYRLNLPVIFIHPSVKEAHKAWDQTGHELTPQELAALAAAGGGVVRIGDIGALYSGSSTGKSGVHLSEIVVISPVAESSHLLLNNDNIALNPLGFANNSNPIAVSWASISFTFSPKIPGT